jgi:hypothetical protein
MKMSPGRTPDLQNALGVWGGAGKELPGGDSDESFRIAALRTSAPGGAVEADTSSHRSSSSAHSEADAGHSTFQHDKMQRDQQPRQQQVSALEQQHVELEKENQRLQRDLESLVEQGAVYVL